MVYLLVPLFLKAKGNFYALYELGCTELGRSKLRAESSVSTENKEKR